MKCPTGNLEHAHPEPLADVNVEFARWVVVDICRLTPEPSPNSTVGRVLLPTMFRHELPRIPHLATASKMGPETEKIHWIDRL